MDKVLITGGKGFLGENLKEELGSLQAKDVWTLDVKGEGDKHFNIPVQDFEKFDEFDEIYHLAAVTDIGVCEKNKSKAWKVNVEGTRNIVSQLEGDQELIYSSTSHIYNDQIASMKIESTREKPSDFYGLTKKVSEDLIRNYSSSKGFGYNILRIFTLYGEDQPRGFLIPDVVDKMKDSRDVEVIDQHSKLSLSCVEDVIEVMSMDIDNGTYNLCEGCYTVGEIYEIIADEIGSGSLKFSDEPGGKFLCGDNSKISKYKGGWVDLGSFIDDIS